MLCAVLWAQGTSISKAVYTQQQGRRLWARLGAEWQLNLNQTLLAAGRSARINVTIMVPNPPPLIRIP